MISRHKIYPFNSPVQFYKTKEKICLLKKQTKKEKRNSKKQNHDERPVESSLIIFSWRYRNHRTKQVPAWDVASTNDGGIK